MVANQLKNTEKNRPVSLKFHFDQQMTPIVYVGVFDLSKQQQYFDATSEGLTEHPPSQG
jgi:hypothetical protein